MHYVRHTQEQVQFASYACGAVFNSEVSFVCVRASVASSLRLDSNIVSIRRTRTSVTLDLETPRPAARAVFQVAGGRMRVWSHGAGLTAVVAAAFLVAEFSAQQPPLADQVISKDRGARAALLAAGRWTPQPYKPGFFGTIFRLIKEQVNDTKSAYSQISTLVNSQFSDNDEGPRKSPGDEANSTETPKISRAEFLRILDRNLKGLQRLRNLEWREAKKDSLANIRAYKLEALKGKNTNGR